jgi:hypothetical protein
LITGVDYDSEAYLADSTAFADYIKTLAPAHLDTIANAFDFVAAEVEEYSNFQPVQTNVVCDYISKEEWEKAQSLIWLDFNKGQFAGSQDLPVGYVKDFPLLKDTRLTTNAYPTAPVTNEYVSRGIHQKGCGLLKYNEKRSVYNYVDQINLKLAAAGKPTLSKVEIYDAANQADVQEAIEELILDEAGLELAFEGSRFADLMRVANRRANPAKFMADKIRTRGESTNAWIGDLESDVRNWFLPLPDYSNRPQ